MNKLDAIRARWAAATPGPWIMERSGPCYEVVRRPGGLRIAWVPYDFGPDEDEANAVAIAHARADIPLLLAVADELAAFLRVMNGAPSEFAFMSLLEGLEIVMRPLLKEERWRRSRS